VKVTARHGMRTPALSGRGFHLVLLVLCLQLLISDLLPVSALDVAPDSASPQQTSQKVQRVELVTEIAPSLLAADAQAKPNGAITKSTPVSGATAHALAPQAKFAKLEECGDNNCMHGTCDNVPETPTCQCDEGWEGPNCDYAPQCDGVTCSNAGTCDAITGACVCVGNWSGENCDEDLCENVDCGDHGSCQAGICVCTDGFTGPSCETAPPCYGVDCNNHGSCNPSNNQCVCEGNWDGATCNVDLCENISCGERGTCVRGQCQCEAGWVSDTQPCDTNCTYPADTTIEACTFYEKCLEATNTCGATGYALSVGKVYCEALTNATAGLTNDGVAWVRSVNQCLQSSLSQYFFSFTAFTCPNLVALGVSTHEMCYKRATPTFCSLPLEDRQTIAKAIGNTFYRPNSLARGLTTLGACASDKSQPFTLRLDANVDVLNLEDDAWWHDLRQSLENTMLGLVDLGNMGDDVDVTVCGFRSGSLIVDGVIMVPENSATNAGAVAMSLGQYLTSGMNNYFSFPVLDVSLYNPNSTSSSGVPDAVYYTVCVLLGLLVIAACIYCSKYGCSMPCLADVKPAPAPVKAAPTELDSIALGLNKKSPQIQARRASLGR